MLADRVSAAQRAMYESAAVAATARAADAENDVKKSKAAAEVAAKAYTEAVETVDALSGEEDVAVDAAIGAGGGAASGSHALFFISSAMLLLLYTCCLFASPPLRECTRRGAADALVSLPVPRFFCATPASPFARANLANLLHAQVALPTLCRVTCSR